jgi:hypothetical protein
MDKNVSLTHKVLVASPWVQFLLYSVTFAILLWLIGTFVIGEPIAWWALFGQAIVFGAIITWMSHRMQRKTDASLGLKTDLQQRVALSHSLKTAKLPEDPALRSALPGYLDTVEKQNRRIRIFGPVEFVIFSALALYLAISSQNPAWYAFTGLFIGFAMLCYYQPNATLGRTAKLRRALDRAVKKEAKAIEAAKAERAAKREARKAARAAEAKQAEAAAKKAARQAAAAAAVKKSAATKKPAAAKKAAVKKPTSKVKAKTAKK